MSSRNGERKKSFSKYLFAGNIEQDLVFPFPEMDREERENLKLLLDSIRQFANDHIDSAAIDSSGEIPKEVLTGLAEIGLFGMTIPEEYGGFGFSSTAYNRVFEEIAAIDASLAVTLGGHLSIGLQALLLHGTEKQKQAYLPRLATGEWLAAFALTEPGAGSDAAGIQSLATPDTSDGRYLLNGSKIWITNGGIADFFTVFAKAPVGDRLENKITAFIVTRDMEGFSSGKEEEKLGIHGSSTTELRFDNVNLSADHIIGEVGKGFKVAMEVLNSGRLGLAAGNLGGMKRLMKMSIEHAKNRRQFDTAIADFEMIQDKISQMAVDIYAVESMVYLTTSLIDRGDVDYSIESAICKIYASESLWRTVNETMQIAGGIGYSKDYPYERALRDARINLIFEGTNEVLRLFVALAGMQQHGEYLRRVGKALQNPLNELGILTDYAMHRIREKVAKERLTNVSPALEKQASKFEEYARQLHLGIEKVLTRYRKDVMRQEFILHRIADVAMDLYAMIAVISRLDTVIKQVGEAPAQRQLTIGKMFSDQAWRRVRRNLRQIQKNHDNWRREIARDSYEMNGYSLDLYN